MKKKVFVPLIALALALPLASCGGENKSEVYYGFGSDATYETDRGGNVQTTIKAASALFDKDGKILDLKVDSLQVKVKAEAADVVLLNATGYNDEANTDIKSKFELRYDYNMKDTSANIGAIEGGAEWFEQTIAFENWAVGKTVAEIEASIDENGDLVNGAEIGNTMTVSNTFVAIKEAYENRKQAETAKEESKVGVAMFTMHAPLQTTVKVGGAVYEGDKVAGSKVDSYQIPYVINESVDEAEAPVFKVAINEESKQVDAANTSVKSKEDLQFDYNMKDTSANIGVIEGGAEWFEQAAAFEAYAIGKTAAELKALELDEEGKPVNGGEIGTTMTVTSFLELYEEAYEIASQGR